MAATKSDSDKPTTDKPVADAPSSAPELSDAQRQKIEAELTVAVVTSDTSPASDKQNTTKAPKGVDVDSLPGGELDAASEPADTPAKTGSLKRFFRAYWRRKLWTLPLTLLVILAIIGVVPYTRYKLAAFIISQPVTITVVDSTTKKPVTSVEIDLNGKTYKTDKDGKVTINDVKVGDQKFTATKKYYKDESFAVFVPLAKAASHQVSLTATGRQVPVVVVNKISGKPIADVTLKSAGSEFKTDKDGKAVVVVPADKVELSVSLTGANLNTVETKLKVTDQAVKENTFSMTSSGTLYFLSRQSGKIDVVKTDLDGANRTVVVTGTGKEEDRGTVLLASRDWKYLTLLSKRDSGLAKLYLIDTSNDKMTEIDSGDASLSLVGWDDHNFVYQVVRNKPTYLEANKVAFKSYNVDKRQLNTIDQNGAVTVPDTGAVFYQNFGSGYLINHRLVYVVTWQYNGYIPPGSSDDKNHSLRTAALDGTNKKDVKTWPLAQYSSYVQTAPYGADELYLNIWSNTNQKSSFYEYENDQVKDADADVGEEKFQTAYPTYLQSPDGKKTFWNEQRDGVQTFFVGDVAGENGKQVAAIKDGLVYGWYGDGYVLISVKGSELYIMPVDGGTPLKVADYHKPQLSYRGYGGGYGGL